MNPQVTDKNGEDTNGQILLQRCARFTQPYMKLHHLHLHCSPRVPPTDGTCVPIYALGGGCCVCFLHLCYLHFCFQGTHACDVLVIFWKGFGIQRQFWLAHASTFPASPSHQLTCLLLQGTQCILGGEIRLRVQYANSVSPPCTSKLFASFLLPTQGWSLSMQVIFVLCFALPVNLFLVLPPSVMSCIALLSQTSFKFNHECATMHPCCLPLHQCLPYQAVLRQWLLLRASQEADSFW